MPSTTCTCAWRAAPHLRSVDGMTSTAPLPVARLSTPGDIAATIPTLCGFVPHDSVVVLSLRGTRRRLGLTVRLDLPPADAAERVAEFLAVRVHEDGGAAAAVAVFGSERRIELVDALVAACCRQDVTVVEAVHVHDGRCTSYLCDGACCPAGGTPVPPVPALVEVQAALDGRAALGDRDDLVRSLAPPAETPRDVLAVAEAQWALEREYDEVAARRTALAQAREALALVARGGTLDLATSVRVAVTLDDVRVRDEVATWSLDEADAVLALTEQVARQVGPPYDAPVCAVLAWVAYSRGDGARANVALDRALRGDPSYSLALLLQGALDGAVPPAVVRRTMQETARVLRGD